MRAGLLKDIIEIYKPQITINDVGEQTTEYVFSYSTRAKKIHNGGSRTVENYENVYPYRKEITVRIFEDIDDFDRIKIWGSPRWYKILEIELNHDLQQKTLIIERVDE